MPSNLPSASNAVDAPKGLRETGPLGWPLSGNAGHAPAPAGAALAAGDGAAATSASARVRSASFIWAKPRRVDGNRNRAYSGTSTPENVSSWAKRTRPGVASSSRKPCSPEKSRRLTKVARQRNSRGGDHSRMIGRITIVRPPGGRVWMPIRPPTCGLPTTRRTCGFHVG